jgi:hypothetical protein
MLLIPIVLLAGLGVGGGTAFGTHLLLAPPAPAAAQKPHEVATSFVPTGKILAPLVFADGRLSGYVAFEVQLETADSEVEFVTARLPLLLNAINMRTFRAPMASGPDGMLPNLGLFQRIVMDSAAESLGPHMVRRVAIMQATPA